LDHVARHLLKALRDRVPMDRAKCHHLQDQEVEGALGEIRFNRQRLYLMLLQVNLFICRSARHASIRPQSNLALLLERVRTDFLVEILVVEPLLPPLEPLADGPALPY
jgi:hypothetical protein